MSNQHFIRGDVQEEYFRVVYPQAFFLCCTFSQPPPPLNPARGALPFFSHFLVLWSKNVDPVDTGTKKPGQKGGMNYSRN